MAVVFSMPNDDSNDGGGGSSQPPNTSTSATQTPLQRPVSCEHLTHAIYESPNRYSVNGSPLFLFPPSSPSCSVHSPSCSVHSPSCSVHSPSGIYSCAEVFFPISFSRQQQQQNLRSPRNTNNNDSSISRRSRLTSTGDDDDHECHCEHETSWDELEVHRYDNFSAGRERLQEFKGRIPPRKKKETPKNKEQSFTWPTVVTVFVFAMGCGYLVGR